MILTYEKLVADYPKDAVCAFCGKKNDNWDQEGFFYLWTKPGMEFEDGAAACRKCMDGEPGRKHSELHETGGEDR